MSRAEPARSGITNPTDPGAIADRLRLSATRLARQLRQQADTGMTPSQLSALAVIHNHGPLTLGALADYERVAPPSVTKLVAKLERDGLVTRTPDPLDRRISYVSTTRAGAQFIEVTRLRKTNWLTDRVRHLTPDKRDRLAAALDVLEELTTDQR